MPVMQPNPGRWASDSGGGDTNPCTGWKSRRDDGTMLPADLVCAGEWLYGQNWIKPLAGELGVHPGTVRRWVAGTAIRKANALAIRQLLEKREPPHAETNK